MSPQHTAAVLHGPKDLRLQSRSILPPQPGQAQVQIIATGICGSDLHYYTHGRNGDFVLRSPLVLGHEAAGIITALGPIAALAEPLAVVLHASRRANFTSTPNPRVCVIGSGAVGLLACSLSIALGASSVTAIDIDERKLDFARDILGATNTWAVPIPSKGTPPPRDKDEAVARSKALAHAALQELGMGSDGFDIVFECTGVESCIQMAIFLARPGSRVALVGMGTPIGYIPLSSSALREVDIIGVFRYANCYPEALDLLGSGKLRGVENMVTQRFPLEQTDRAFETLRRGRDENDDLVVKVMVDVTETPTLTPPPSSDRILGSLAPPELM
ncbi:hypothetical protein FRB99_007165 [Tulasnella sp. 403]|nr:hypothetical protein FRB99_007165 [Tulasnella sp. 403]